MIAPVEKPPLTLRVSVTDRCQLRCQYCMPPEGVSACGHEDVLTFEEIAAFVEHLQASYDVRKVRLTGGDPLVRKGIVDLVALLAGLGIPDLAMTTNAQRLSALADDLAAAGLNRVNISLDSLNPGTFEQITRREGVRNTIEGIEAAIRADLRPVKLNMVVMQGINDQEVCEVLSFALERGCELRFIELMPIGFGASHFDKRFVSTASIRRMLTSRFELAPMPRTPGSSSTGCRVRGRDGAGGVVGFISPCTDRFCSDCTRLRLTSDGRLMGCLARKEGYGIRPLLRRDRHDALTTAVRKALRCKRVDSGFEQPVSMAAIGG